MWNGHVAASFQPRQGWRTRAPRRAHSRHNGDMDRFEEVRQAAVRRLGEFDVVADHSWELGLAVVLEVVSSGGPLVLKGHAEPRLFEVEVEAYHEVVPAIADRAPALCWVDEPTRVIAISLVLGRSLGAAAPDADRERSIYRDAGEVLRRLHSAKPATELTHWAEDKIEGFERWVNRAPAGLLEPGDVAFARAKVSLLAESSPPVGVSCHGDWQPRNWLVGEDGTIRIFDFERVSVDWWGHDIQRMWWREWDGRPDLAEAHFEGYGRAPTDEELAVLRATSAAGHITQIVWGTEHGDRDFAEAGWRSLRSMRAAD